MTTAMSLRTLLPRHRDVDALGRADRVGVRALVERAHVVGPHAGGVDDDLRPRRRSAGRRPRTVAPSTWPSASFVSADDAARLATTAPWCGRRAGERQREAGVVGAGVVVEVGAGEPVARQRRHVARRRRRPSSRLWQLADADPAGEVVHPHRRAEGPGHPPGDDAVLGEDRDQERQQLDEVRRVAAQALALGSAS